MIEDKQKPNILVADDDDHILNLLLLCLSDYNVTRARNGQEALDMWKSSKYDLVVLDLMMPKINGWEVCREIRQESADVPILILTAKDTPEDLFEGSRPDGFLVKPFDPAELVKKIDLMLRRR